LAALSTPVLYASALVLALSHPRPFFFFFFNHPATTELYTLSLHDALPIWSTWAAPTCCPRAWWPTTCACRRWTPCRGGGRCWCGDRKSTRLNSSHVKISYAVFCLKKKKTRRIPWRAERTTHCPTRTADDRS